jgi:D-alanyl-D-alanine carboxypeptidase-like protein
MALSGIHPALYVRMQCFSDYAQRQGLAFEVTSTYRSASKQRQLYADWEARGFTGLPVAKPGCSLHQYGLAVDMVAYQPERSDELVGIAGECGLIWAGPSDPVHFGVLSAEQWRDWLGSWDSGC